MKALFKVITILTILASASGALAGPPIVGTGGVENPMAAMGPGIGGGMEKGPVTGSNGFDQEAKGPGIGGGMEDSSIEHVYFMGKDQDIVAYAIAKRGRATMKSESVTVMPEGLKQSLRDSRMNKSWEVMSRSSGL